MEKKKWLWKRRSSETSPGETESSGSISSHSERLSEDQDTLKASPNNDTQSPEVMSKTVAVDEDVNDTIKCLTERLSAALVDASIKDDLAKQHAKVAEEAVAGWEKAENEAVVMKKKLEVATHRNSALEDRVSHLDGALKECVRQLRQAREEQEQKINEAVAKKTCEWESKNTELENQLFEFQAKAEAAKFKPPQIDPDLLDKLEYLAQENASLKLELLSQSEELEVRTIERDLSTQAAETASKQHLESIKKVAKLEAECRRLKTIACKSPSISDNRNSAASSIYVESLTDSQSDSGERLNAVEMDSRKVSYSETYKCEPSCSDSWASALIAELDQFKNEKAINHNVPASATEIDLMDDFLEMERLAALPETENATHHSEQEAGAEHSNVAESSLRAELEIMVHRTAQMEEKLEKLEDEKIMLEDKLHKMEGEKIKLEEKVQKLEGEKVQLEENLEKMKAEKDEMEMALTKSQEDSEASKLHLKEGQAKLEKLQEDLSTAKESRQQIESQIINMEVDARTMSAKVNALEAEVEKERAQSAEIAVKFKNLQEELSRKTQEVELQKAASSSNELKIKQEDLAMAAGKLAECQKTIMSLGKQLKSLATLEDFLIDTASLPEFSAGTSAIPKSNGESWKLHSNETFSPKRDSVSSRIGSASSGPSITKNEGNSPPSSSSSTSSAVSTNHINSEKNRNGFAKFFSRSKNGIQLEL